MISKFSLINSTAKLGKNIKIGPWSKIGSNVTIGDNTIIHSNVNISSGTYIGKNNEISQFVSLGGKSQNIKSFYNNSFLKIGNNNIFREYCTIHKGKFNNPTIIGNNCYFMCYSHVAHDCNIGNNVILSNNASISGHVVIENNVIIGGMSGIHQFCKIGESSFISGGTIIFKDVIPYTIIANNPSNPIGINFIGLKRYGINKIIIQSIKKAYKIIFREKNTINESINKIKKILNPYKEILKIIKFIYLSKRGVIR